MGLFDVALGVFSFFTGVNVDSLKSGTKGALERLNEMERNGKKLLRETRDPEKREQIEAKLEQIREKKEEILQKQQQIMASEKQINEGIDQMKYNRLLGKINTFQSRLKEFDQAIESNMYEEYESKMNLLCRDILDSLEDIHNSRQKKELEDMFYSMSDEDLEKVNRILHIM